MTAISPTADPVAVTGASGYIGSWLVTDLMKQSHAVRACVRATSSPDAERHAGPEPAPGRSLREAFSATPSVTPTND